MSENYRVKQLVAGKTVQAERSGADRVFNLAANKVRSDACAGGTAQVVALRLRAQWREASEAIRDSLRGWVCASGDGRATRFFVEAGGLEATAIA